MNWFYGVFNKKVNCISVGVQNDGHVTLDICEEREVDSEWDFHVLSIEDAEFLLEELTNALTRARPRAAKLQAKLAEAAAKEAAAKSAEAAAAKAV